MSKKPTSKQTTDTPLLCLICGDIARGLNFDVITCMSCKAFFRRNAAKSLQCQSNNDCSIHKYSRSGCSACRLKKCYALGMNPQLIRSTPQKTSTARRQRTSEVRNRSTEVENTSQAIVPIPQENPVTLTHDEWNLLSNVLSAYDEQNLVQKTENALKSQLSLPPKLRSKQTHTLNLLGLFYSSINSFLERSPFFNSLSPALRRLMIENNLNGTGALNLLYTAAQAKLFDHLYLIVNCDRLYGSDYVQENQRLLARLENNGTLIKLMLMILSFASNSSPLIYQQSRNSTVDSSESISITLLQIQNIFITMMWKYLLYQYGFQEAVKRFDHLVKNYLDILNRINANLTRAHWTMLDGILNKTTNALTYDH